MSRSRSLTCRGAKPRQRFLRDDAALQKEPRLRERRRSAHADATSRAARRRRERRDRLRARGAEVLVALGHARAANPGSTAREAGPERLVVDHGLCVPNAAVVFVHNLATEASAHLSRPDWPRTPTRNEVSSRSCVRRAGRRELAARGARSWRFPLAPESVLVQYPGFRSARFNPARAANLRAGARRELGIAADVPLVGMITSGDFEKRGLDMFAGRSGANHGGAAGHAFPGRRLEATAGRGSRARLVRDWQRRVPTEEPRSGALVCGPRSLSLSRALRRVRDGRLGGAGGRLTYRDVTPSRGRRMPAAVYEPGWRSVRSRKTSQSGRSRCSPTPPPAARLSAAGSSERATTTTARTLVPARDDPRSEAAAQVEAESPEVVEIVSAGRRADRSAADCRARACRRSGDRTRQPSAARNRIRAAPPSQ